MAGGSAAERAKDLTLWYRQPAKEWLEALPVGNGKLAAMVFGGVESERLQLNEGSLWSGRTRETDNLAAISRLAEVRKLIFANNFAEAERIAGRSLAGRGEEGPGYPACYQSLGELSLRMGAEGEASDYRRELNLETGVVTVRYRQGDALFTREIFASAPDNVLVVRLSCDKPGRIDCAARLTRSRDAALDIPRPDRMTLRGQCDAGKGLKFAACLQVINQGGTLAAFDEGVLVEQADAATFLLAAGTNYRQPNGPEQDPSVRGRDELNLATGKSYEELKEAHLRAHSALFGRVSLDLSSAVGPSLPTDQRLAAFRKGSADPGLFALYFQYGRYLLLSSSQPGGLPANGQGIWNDQFEPVGNGDYQLDGGLEMAYWGAETANLSECHLPLFDFLDGLRDPGHRTAKIHYGQAGFVAHNRGTPWGRTSPGPDIATGQFPAGAAWLCLHLWEHYLFTGDKDFLETKAWPIMKEAAEFFVDFLVADPKKGWLVTSPSVSPGGAFRAPNGQVASLCAGPALDSAIVRELFLDCVEAAKVLKLDKDLRKGLEVSIPQLAPPQIGKKGRLQEWLLDVEPASPGGSRLSPLFPLYPAAQFAKGQSNLLAAARATLESQPNLPGPSRAWEAACWARLGRGERAREKLQALIGEQTAANLMNLVPGPVQPGGFQINGNLAAMAAVAEMLVQSQGGEIDFLPALPDQWPDGSVSGLRARGGFVVGLAWKNRRLTEATATSTLGGVMRLGGAGDAEIKDRAKSVAPKKLGNGLVEFKTERDHTYTIRFKP